MRTIRMMLLSTLVLAAAAAAQQNGAQPNGTPPAPAVKAPKVTTSPQAKAALAAAKELAGKVKGTDGPARNAALEAAAKAYDQVATDHAGEPAVAARARFEAGELWRRRDSLAQAEQDYLQAAALDAAHFGQRGLLAAADMQRRQKQLDQALATYAKAAAAEPNTTRAHDARLWQARLLQGLGRMDEAIAGFRAAVEAAQRPRQVIEASDWLAKALIKHGDYDGAAAAIQHAETEVGAADDSDPVEVERLRKALEAMSARKALQRARDKQVDAGKDAGLLEENGGGR